MIGRILLTVCFCALSVLAVAGIEIDVHVPERPQWTPVASLVATADPGFVITNQAAEVTESLELPDTFWMLDQSPVTSQTVEVATVAKPPDPAWMQSVHAVRVHGISTRTGRQVICDGTGFAVSSDRILTCNHLLYDLRNFRAEVQVAGDWQAAVIQRIPDANDQSRDWLYLDVPGLELEPVTFRVPQYMEPVTVYGLKSAVPQQGIVSANDTVSLQPDSHGIVQGDSGGGVFGVDGCYLGTLRGHQQGQSLVAAFSSVVPEEGLSKPSGDDSQLIVFSASWCGPCHQYEATLKTLDWTDILIVDIDTDAGKRVMRDLNVTVANVPTTVLVEDGKIIKTQVGAVSAEQVRQFAGRGPA